MISQTDKMVVYLKDKSVNLRLWAVRRIIEFENLVLNAVKAVLFTKLKTEPQNILIYKTGNIGDIICALPSFIAIRRGYPEAKKITLLTSPGKKGSAGAEELLAGSWYIDDLKIYHTEDIKDITQKIYFINELKKKRYDLFVHLPSDAITFKTLLRDMIFAKAIGAKYAFGFKIRSTRLFKKIQVDHLFNKTEAESLLDILKGDGLTTDRVEFGLNIPIEQKNNAEKLFQEKWGDQDTEDVVVAISLGAKRESNIWPIDRFGETALYLQSNYNAKIIMIGGENDISKANIVKTYLKDDSVLITTGRLKILETFALLKHCSFLIANSTGPIHLAAAAGIPTVGLFTVRDIPGRWFPYGGQHKILYHNFIDGDYKDEECIKRSIEMISVEEVKKACDEIINKHRLTRKTYAIGINKNDRAAIY